jgi:hypothetical protein
MVTEFVLTAITLAVAIFGTTKDKIPRNGKRLLIGLAVATSVASVMKVINDEDDKKFLQTALISTLRPSNAVYEKLCRDVAEVAKTMGFDEETICHHAPDGMVTFFSNGKKTQHGTVVFDRSEIGKMYANHLRDASNRTLIVSVLHKAYVPKEFSEEFLDKVGILGFGIFFNLVKRFPSEYHYDPSIGVQIYFDNKKVGFDAPELAGFEENKAFKLFYLLGESYRKKFNDAQVQR